MFFLNLANFKFFITIFILHSSVINSSSEKFPEEEGILVLNQDNFDAAIKDNEHILVEFYAPWCGHCKELAPKYVQAAKQLKEEGSKIKMAKVDATVEKELGDKLNIEAFPTLNYFIKGRPLKYHGALNAQSLISWLKLRQAALIAHLNSVDEIKKFTENVGISIVGFFKDNKNPEAQILTNLAFDYSSINFGISSNPDALKEYKVYKDSLVLFKKFDEGRSDLVLTSELVSSFIARNSYPLMQEFFMENSTEAFGDNKVTKIMLFFVRKQSASFNEHLDLFKNKVLPQFKGQIVFFYVDVESEGIDSLLNYLNVKPEDAPTYMMLDKSEGMENLKKIKFDSLEFHPEALTTFIKEAINGKLKPSLKSEPLPKNWNDNPVKIVVAKTFEKFIGNKTTSKFVEFYASWCGDCKELAPIWEELGKEYKDHKEIVIAKIDADANEFPDFKIVHLPSIKYYPKDSSDVIDFVGEKTLANFEKFLDSNGKEGNVKPDEVTKKDEL